MSFTSRSSESIFLLVPDDNLYVVPRRVIKIPSDVALWERSEAYKEYLEFLIVLNQVIKGKKFSTECHISDNVQCILNILDKVEQNIDIIKPYGKSHNFSSPAFTAWYDIMKTEALEFLQHSLPDQYDRALAEIHFYFMEAFGNAAVGDYGLVHEISFIMFLCCLYKIGVFVEEDKLAIVLCIFKRYLEVIRKLHQSYRMKSADVQSIWSLDKYHFVPFIWGSAQLIDHPELEPMCFLDKSLIEKNSHEYMYLSCVEYINKVKTGCFCEHPSQLWSIAHVRSWSKINQGLINMYKEQVLNKFPIIQQILFGSVMSFQPVNANNISAD